MSIEASVMIQQAITSLDRELERRVLCALKRLGAQISILDTLERELDDVPDEKIRARLQKVLAGLDDAREDAKAEIGGLASYDLWDPLRIIAADIRDDGV
jgi:hypothetical protein